MTCANICFAFPTRMTEFGLAMNIHINSSCILSDNYLSLEKFVQDAMNAFSLDVQSLNPRQFKEANRILRQLKIRTTHKRKNGEFVSLKPYVIESILNKTPHDVSFELNGSVITIAEYFKQTYDITVSRYPLVRTTSKATFSKDPRERINFPIEVCELLPNQFVNDSKHDQFVKTELLRLSKTDPNVYFDKVTKIAERISRLEPDFMEEIGFILSPKPVKLNGRVLPLPIVNDGNRTFHQVAKAPANWRVISFDDSCTSRDLNNFVSSFCREASKRGLNFAMPQVEQVAITDTEKIFQVIGSMKAQYNLDFVFVVIPKCMIETIIISFF